jgi:hypothetical protein
MDTLRNKHLVGFSPHFPSNQWGNEDTGNERGYIGLFPHSRALAGALTVW